MQKLKRERVRGRECIYMFTYYLHTDHKLSHACTHNEKRNKCQDLNL